MKHRLCPIRALISAFLSLFKISIFAPKLLEPQVSKNITNASFLKSAKLCKPVSIEAFRIRQDRFGPLCIKWGKDVPWNVDVIRIQIFNFFTVEDISKVDFDYYFFSVWLSKWLKECLSVNSIKFSATWIRTE